MDPRNSYTPSEHSPTPDREAGATTLPDETEEADEFDAVLRELARPPAGPRSSVADTGGYANAALADAPAVGEAVRDALHTDRRARSEPARGDVIDGSYLVISVLGRGGMGVVLAAENLRTGKRVALKWMSHEHGAMLTPKVVERFRREARAVAKVRHRNVVDVYDSGESDGTPFIVMELLEGESLRQRIARGPLPWNEARLLMLEVLRGVSAVHRAEVVHRDLKPDNVFLCAVEGASAVVPKVLDFGIAAMSAGSREALDTLTRTGALIGTPSYMALEQLTGGTVDERADVYALGVVFYEMLTQRLPFAGRTPGDLAVLQATTLPTRPSQHVPTLRGQREQTVMRALARKPEDRYPSAAAFARALEAEPGPRRTLRHVLGFSALLIGLLGVLFYVVHVAAPSPVRTPEFPRAVPAVAAPLNVPPAVISPPATADREPGPFDAAVAPEPIRRTLSPRKPPRAAPSDGSRHESSPETRETSEPMRGRTDIRLDDF